MIESKTVNIIAGIQNFLAIIAAYLLSFHLEHFFRLLIGMASGLVANYSVSGVNFLATRSEWVDCDCVVITYIAGPLILAIIGVVLHQKLKRNLEEGKTLSRLAFWMAVFSLTRFFGGFLAGWLTHKGLWFSMSWAYLPSTIQLVGGGIMFLVLLIIFIHLRVAFLANEGISSGILEERQYYAFTMVRLILPFVIAAILLYALFLRNQGLYEIILYAMASTVILPILLGAKAMRLQLFKFPDYSLRRSQARP